jgi:hypothetical protein
VISNRAQIKAECDAILEQTVTKSLADLWWQSRNKAFFLKTPEEMLDEDPQSVLSYLKDASTWEYS